MSTIIENELIIIAILVVLVNIITEVMKKAWSIKSAKTINIMVTIMSVVFSVVANIYFIGDVSAQGIIISIICGFMVAYGAMFGYDKLLSYFKPFIGE